MAATFTIPEILAATGGTLVRLGAWDAFCGVSTDSRTCQTGELFIPLTGEKHDGHEFIPGALRRGARGVLVEEKIFRPAVVGTGFTPAPAAPPEVTIIAVPDALTALGDLARAWRDRFPGPVVGITGSCGKTTTKEMIAAVLAPGFRVLKNRLNLNNLIGMPLTLLGLEGTHEAAVVEMGMNAFGEINRLTQIARPTVGVLTNVHPAHTEGVGDIAGVARAKGELIRALDHGARLIYNADDPWVARLAQDFSGPRLGFGLNPGAALRAHSRRPLGRDGQVARLSGAGREWPLTLPAPGLHMLYNALAATAVGLALGLAPEATAAALGQFQAIHRRSQVVTLSSGVHLLNDCYNANPGSMAMALSTLMELKDHGRAAAALGDMLELGNGAAADHRELGRRAARQGLDILVIYGNHRLDVADGAREAGLPADRIFPVERRADGALILRKLLAPEDWLLVKGSRSMHMEGLIDHLEET
jgi:UDP-N-acetylmuramoyl-tripeptide--D-alanyl-D-alanine ligase